MDHPQDFYSSGKTPYPPLVRQLGERDQALYFLEPAHPTKEGGAGKLLPSQLYGHLQPPASFGPLSTSYQITNGPVAIRHVFCRWKRGTQDHGLKRNDEAQFELGKFNILRYPVDNDFNNPDYLFGHSLPVEGLDKAVLALADYPSVPNAVMRGPLMPAIGGFSKPLASQPSGFTLVTQIEELFQKILGFTMHRWEDVGNFARTCQLVLGHMNQTMARFNISKGDFLNLHVDPEDNATLAEGLSRQAGSIGFVMVSNVREPCEPTRSAGQNSYGFPKERVEHYSKVTASQQLMHHIRFLKTINLRGQNIKVLHLHSMPYLDLKTLDHCLERLPVLQILAVHNCDLLHFGCTVDFLKMVIDYNKRKDRKPIEADFSPRYFYGKRSYQEGRVGEYGVVAQDEGTIDTLRAVVATLQTVVPLALKNGIDWFTPGTGMRQFLERLPWELDTLRYILEALYDLVDLKNGVHDNAYPIHVDKGYEAVHARAFDRFGPHVFVASEPSGWDESSSNDSTQGEQKITPFLRDEMFRTVYHDLIIAMTGKPMLESKLRDIMTSRGKFLLLKCCLCKTKMPSCFFVKSIAARPDNWRVCHGCQLGAYLNQQVNNYERERREVVRLLWDDPNVTDLDTLFKAKRLATVDELDNLSFPFQQVAVKLMVPIEADLSPHFYPTVLSDPGWEAIGRRPRESAPDEWKEISILKERLHAAWWHAKRQIDLGASKSNAVISNCRAHIELIKQRLLTADGNSAHKLKLEQGELETRINQEEARQGLVQMTPKGSFKVAGDWDENIKQFRHIVQCDAGLHQNIGPTPILNKDKIW